ncbi:hypothetical protein VDG05_17700 [Xanthomonas campestris pv. raphani]|uniref:hypothetical protein n=1 Tax=Xanthomonas campestris TaxID=339 RepID=UPI002B22B1DE|nr:hypothetical protein [Xanthomonas campestris]MEA9886142.1 hypothetical protein [Xanthomonas campestris pv. raphani]
MAITDNNTANEVNTLLNWLFPSAGRRQAVPREAAMKAAEQLANKAHRQLVDGVHGAKIRDAVPIDEWRFDPIDNGGR